MNESEIKEVLGKIHECNKDITDFTSYAIKKMSDRNIAKEIIFEQLFSDKIPYIIEKQQIVHQGKPEIRYKLVFSLSGRYSLIIIIALYPNSLKVINAIRTSKKLQEKWKKEALK